MTLGTALKWTAGAVGLATGAYASYVGIAWHEPSISQYSIGLISVATGCLKL